jgi:hypothetical protein
MWVALLPTKDCTEAAIKRITKAAKLESGHRLYALRIDRDGEFNASSLNAYSTELGVRAS